MKGISPTGSILRPDVVLIDLDNTLYAYEPAHAAGMDAVRSKCAGGLGLDAGSFDAQFRAARDEVKSKLAGTAAAHNRLLYFQRLIEICTKKSDPMLSLDLEKTYWRRFLASAELFVGVRDFIDELRFAKIPTVLVTDLTAQIQMRKLIYFELDHAFDTIVTSEEVGVDKPSPRVFQLALDKAGMQASSVHAWMIGDSADNDIRGAKNAIAAFTAQKLHAGVQRCAEADMHFTEFSELLDYAHRALPRVQSR